MVTKVKQTRNWKVVSLSALLIGSIIGSIAYLYIDKNRAHEYVCQVVGFDGESGMMAMKCMYR